MRVAIEDMMEKTAVKHAPRRLDRANDKSYGRLAVFTYLSIYLERAAFEVALTRSDGCRDARQLFDLLEPKFRPCKETGVSPDQQGSARQRQPMRRHIPGRGLRRSCDRDDLRALLFRQYRRRRACQIQKVRQSNGTRRLRPSRKCRPFTTAMSTRS